MKNLANHIQYYPIQSIGISESLEREFFRHKEIAQEVYFYMDGFPNASSFYRFGDDNASNNELITQITNSHSTYIVHSINQRDTLIYVHGDDILNYLTQKYEKDDLEELITSRYKVLSVPKEIKLSNNCLYLSNQKIQVIGHISSIQEMQIDLDIIMDYFAEITHLEEDTQEDLDSIMN